MSVRASRVRLGAALHLGKVGTRVLVAEQGLVLRLRFLELICEFGVSGGELGDLGSESLDLLACGGPVRQGHILIDVLVDVVK